MPKLSAKEEKRLRKEATDLVEKKLVYFEADPNFTDSAHRNADAIAYFRGDDNLLEAWVHQADEWKQVKKNIKPGKAAAAGHYDELKWQFHNKEDNELRKQEDVSSIDKDDARERLRSSVRYFYDLQKLRIQFGNRDSDQYEPALLEGTDKTFLGRQSIGLEALEKSALNEIEHLLNLFPIWTEWLQHQTGVGPTMGGVLIAEIDIGEYRKRKIAREIFQCESELDNEYLGIEDRATIEARLELLKERLANINPCDTVSSLWAYCGLHTGTKTGKAVRRRKGEKANWNSFLKSKVVFVMGSNLIRSGRKSGDTTWTKFYDDYKHRKQSQVVATCELCEGRGGLTLIDKKVTPADWEKGQRKKGVKKCYACDGKAHDVPWGRGDKHRHNAATRYMVKCFLQELWLKWRELEGLPVTRPYAEVYLDRKHGDHKGSLHAQNSPGT